MNPSRINASSRSFHPLDEFGSKVQQTVMPLVAFADGHLIPLGTGFMIAADGLMVTAGHVIDEALNLATRKIDSRGHHYDHLELGVIYATSERHGPNNEHYVGGILPIVNAWRPPELDIALFTIRSFTRNDRIVKFPIVRLSPAVPAIGTHILGFGYYGMKGSPIEFPAENEYRCEYLQETAQTCGVITDVFPVNRDAGMLHFPCFQTDARFDPGMSGGPIFNETGGVCGVICSSWPKSDFTPEHISYGSLIWPAFGISIVVTLEEGREPQNILIHELATRGVIDVDNSFSNITIVKAANGSKTVSIQF